MEIAVGSATIRIVERLTAMAKRTYHVVAEKGCFVYKSANEASPLARA